MRHALQIARLILKQRKRKWCGIWTGIDSLAMEQNRELRNISHKCIWYMMEVTLQICGLPRWLSGKESACQCRRLGQKDPWRRKWQPTPEFLPWKSQGQRSLVGYSPWGSKRVGHDWANTHTCTQNCTKSIPAHTQKPYISIKQRWQPGLCHPGDKIPT